MNQNSLLFEDPVPHQKMRTSFPNFNGEIIALDVETTGLSHTDRVFGVAISTKSKDFYFDVRVHENLLNWLKTIRPKKIVNHNIKFDLHMLRNSGIKLDPAICECTMIRAALIDEKLAFYSLDFLLEKYLGESKYKTIYHELARIFGGKPDKSQAKHFFDAPFDLMEKYGKQDSRGAYNLWEWQEQTIKSRGLERIWKLEKKLFPVLFRSEVRGIKIDVNKAEKSYREIESVINRTIKNLSIKAGFLVNPNPGKSLERLLVADKNEKGQWITAGGEIIPSTNNGKPCLSDSALSGIKHPLMSDILKCRKLMKVRDTFLKNHILEKMRNGRLYPIIHQTKGDSGLGVGTGRLSYARPALQQIPSRDKEIAEMVRPIFIPEEGHGWSYGDLDQHEYRVFAHYVDSPEIIEAYRQNPDIDFHQRIADLTGLPRSAQKSGGPNAKQLNLGMVFCMGAGHLAALCGLPYTWDSFTDEDGTIVHYQKAGPEGLAMVEQYHRMVPGVKEMANWASNFAKERGYIETIHGRHIHLNGAEVRKASGLLYQGSSADLNKENLIVIDEYLESTGGSLILNIHDEYSVSLPNDGQAIGHLREIKRLIENKQLKVPIRVDFSEPSANWWEATRAKTVT